MLVRTHKTSKLVSAPALKSANLVIPVSTSPPSKRRSRRRRKTTQNRNDPRNQQRALQGVSGGAREQLLAYTNTLNDPFQYGPVRLGYGTMVPTTVTTVYYRGALTVNADGTFVVASFPTVRGTSGSILYNISGSAGVTWGQTRLSNDVTVSTLLSAARVISMGIRAKPLLAATATPGILYSGTIPRISIGSIAAQSTIAVTGSPYSEWSSSDRGAVVRWRPVDSQSYEIIPERLTNTSTFVYDSVPFIGGAGFPASTQVMLEVVMNLEGVGTIGASLFNGDAPQPQLSDYFPSVDSLWSYIKGAVGVPSFESSNLDTILQMGRAGKHIYDAIRGSSGPTIEVLHDEM